MSAGMSESDLTALPEGWRPKDGDVLIGSVTEVTRGWSDYADEYYPIVVVQPKGDGPPVAVHAFHQVLKNRLTELRPRIGEELGIKYVGQTRSKDGKRTITVYIVKVNGRDNTAEVWDSVDATPRVASDIPTDDDIPFD